MDENKKNIKTFSAEWFSTHNFLPYLFTGLLAFMGIINYFGGVSTKVEVLQTQVQNFQGTINLLNDTIDTKLRELNSLSPKCQAVMGASTSATRSK